MNPHSEDDRRELMTAVEHSREQQGHVRESYRKLVRRSAGSEWYSDGAKESTPINQMAQTEQTLVQHLIGGEPRALVVGSDDSEAAAYEQTLALNKVAQQIGLRRKLRRLVQNAIYGGMGIAKIGMVAGRQVPIREIAPELDEEAAYQGEVTFGSLTLDVISLEAWVYDHQADTLEEWDYCGHAYWVNAEDIDAYLPGVRKTDVLDDEKRQIDEHGSEMAGAISRGTEGGGQAPYGKKVWLWDLWLQHEKKIVTTQVNGTGEFAYVRDWNSRPGGPYLFLRYLEVPDQAMPKSVLADLAPVHDSMNSTLRKLIDLTREMKTVLGFKPGHEDDARRILDSSTRMAIQMRDPSAVKEFTFNGPSPELLAMLLQLKELASSIGGNTDVLAGLSPQAPTATQEQQLNANANVRVQAMELDTVEFVTEVFEAMRWFLFHEQMEPIQIVKQVEGVDLRIPDEWSAAKAADTSGRFDAFEMQIESYASLAYTSPEQRLQKIVDWLREVVFPALQMGLTSEAPDIDRLNEIAAQYMNLPELKSILRFLDQDEQGLSGSGGGEPRQSPVTTRNYVRHGAPGPNQHGQAMQAMQMMGSGQPTGAEA